MRFLIVIFHLLLVLSYVVTKSYVEFIFNAISLGHSGLLVIWKPNITTQSAETSMYFLTFEICTVEEKNEENSKFDDHRSLKLVGTNNNCSKPKTQISSSNEGSFKIHSLKENTLYEISIKQSVDSSSVIKTYFLRMRTNQKSNRIPAKPYFEYISNKSMSSEGLIRWYPCGRERICQNQEGGTHFGITIKQPYSTRRLSEVRKEEFYTDYMKIVFLPGRIYEVVVYSVNGEGKTDSDSQEILLNPISTPVHHVKVIPLPDLSILISWKPPKQSMGPQSYIVAISNFSEPNANEENYIFNFGTVTELIEYSNHVLTITERGRIFGLIPEVTYNYIILPFGESGLGFEYQMKYKLPVYNHNLPIAKPDFNYKLLLQEDTTCHLQFQWLPCGQSFDCENFKPGSEYSFQFEPEPLDTDNCEEEAQRDCEVDFYLDVVYDVTVKSLIGSNFSESRTRKFKNCEEI